MIPQSIRSSLHCCVIWLDCWTAAWWHHYSLTPPKQHGRWFRAEPLMSVVWLTSGITDQKHRSDGAVRKKIPDRNTLSVICSQAPPLYIQIVTDCMASCFWCQVQSGNLSVPFFLLHWVENFLSSLLRLYLHLYAGGFQLWWEGVTMEWCLTVVCTLVFRRLQPSHLWLSSNEQLGCVWLAGWLAGFSSQECTHISGCSAFIGWVWGSGDS